MSEKNKMLFWFNYYWAGPKNEIYDSICTLIKNHGNIVKAMMADDSIKLKKKVGEWHDIMKNYSGNGDIEGWGRCLGILMEIRDYRKEGK